MENLDNIFDDMKSFFEEEAKKKNEEFNKFKEELKDLINIESLIEYY